MSDPAIPRRFTGSRLSLQEIASGFSGGRGCWRGAATPGTSRKTEGRRAAELGCNCERGRAEHICAHLSIALLAGLLANALVGWWWADPLAGLVIVYYGLKEGWAAYRGEA